MDIGIGIPNALKDVTGPDLLHWAQRAEAAGFSSLASIGALSYPSYEELTVFAAAGAVTDRIGFLSNVLIAPARTAAELAKQAATVDQLTGGRLTLGLGVGWRAADFTLAGHDFNRRGETFDRQLRDLAAAWAGQPLAPETRPVAPPTAQSAIPLLIGGTSDATIRRVLEYGAGWTAGGMPPDAVAEFGGKVRDAWQQAGKAGAPRIVALVYFSLGDTEEQSRRNLLDYYQPMGPDVAEAIAGGALRSEDAVKSAIAAYTDAGVDELILDPSVGDVAQVEQLAAVALG